MPSHTVKERKKRSKKGAAIPTAGALVSGGDIPTAGGFDLGASADKPMENPRNHFNLYHQVLKMNPHEWEAVREASSVGAGFVKSPMWPTMKPSTLISSRGMYQRVGQIIAPHVAAKILENEAFSQRGGFHDALLHSMKMAADNLPSLVKSAPAIIRQSEVHKLFPVLNNLMSDKLKNKISTEPELRSLVLE